MTAALTPAVVAGIVELIPDDWLVDDALFDGPDPRDAQRRAYRDWLLTRLDAPRAFVEEAVRARAAHV